MRYAFFIVCLFFARPVYGQLPLVEQPAFRADTFNILNYGALPGGGLNTLAIRDAIQACSKAGGGVVLIPKGLWPTGPIELKGGVNLHVAQGAIVQFSDNPDDFPLIKTNWEGLDAIRAQSPISAKDVENIAITGHGILDGAGGAWRPVKKSKLTSAEWQDLVKSGGVLNEAKDIWYPTARALKGSTEKRPGVIAEGYDLQKAEAIREFLRPNMVSLVGCRRVLLDGVTFQNSPAWCIHPLLTQHLTLRGLSVRNPWNAQNGDGVDVESCRYVLIEHCTFDVGDDGICIKSGRDAEGRKRGVPTEDVIVRSCTVFHGHGGFVIGSEMSGGARNIYVSDCDFLGTDVGLRFKTTRGRGGIVEKIFVDNIRMVRIGGAAILFDMYYMARDPLAGGEDPEVRFEPVTEATPQFRDFHIRQISCRGAETAIFIRGLPEMNIAGIEITDVMAQSTKGIVCSEGDGIILKNISLKGAGKNAVEITNSQNVLLHRLESDTPDVLMQVKGNRSKNIRLVEARAVSARKEIELGEEVSKTAVVRK